MLRWTIFRNRFGKKTLNRSDNFPIMNAQSGSSGKGETYFRCYKTKSTWLICYNISKTYRLWKKKNRILTAHHDEIVIIFGGFHGLETLAQQRHLLLGERERVEQAHERQKLRPRAHLSEARPQIRVRADGRDRQVVRHFFPASHVRKREKKETGYIERRVLNEISI